MKTVLRVFLGCVMLLVFGLWGMWTFAPQRALDLWQIAPTNALGRNAITNDMGGAFLALGLFLLLSFLHNSRWLVPAAITTSALLASRVVGLFVGGVHPPGTTVIVLEALVLIACLVVAMVYPSNIKRHPYHDDFLHLHWFRINYKSATFVRLINALMRRVTPLIPMPSGLSKTSTQCAGWQGKQLSMEIFAPKDLAAGAPCLIYYHGGGFMMVALPHQRSLAYEYALKAQCQVVFVDYSVSVDHPYPAGVEDSYAAFLHIHKEAEALGIDPTRIALGGDSAGATMATVVALMARDREGPDPCFQMLVYPVTDDEMDTPSARLYQDTPVWNTPSTRAGFHHYMRGHEGPIPAYAFPMRAETLAGLPPAYVEVAEIDPLRDEGVAYADKLKADGVDVTFLEIKGAIHGFEVVAKSPITRAAVKARVGALQGAFHAEDMSLEEPG